MLRCDEIDDIDFVQIYHENYVVIDEVEVVDDEKEIILVMQFLDEYDKIDDEIEDDTGILFVTQQMLHIIDEVDEEIMFPIVIVLDENDVNEYLY